MATALQQQEIGPFISPNYWDEIIFDINGAPLPGSDQLFTERAAHAAGTTIVSHVASGRAGTGGQIVGPGKEFNPAQFPDDTVVELQIEAVYSDMPSGLVIRPEDFANLKIPDLPVFGDRRELVDEDGLVHYVTTPWYGAVRRTGLRGRSVLYACQAHMVQPVGYTYSFAGEVQPSTDPAVVGKIEAMPTYMQRVTSLQFYLPDTLQRVVRSRGHR